MENDVVKTFTVVDTETQTTKVINSSATTVAALKRDLVANGFNVTDKTIQEAITRTEFKDDNSLLPHDVPYKGRITNDLVFRLTKSNKQIKSGSIDRKEVYAVIKAQNLEEDVKKAFGRNFTQVSTENLANFINNHRNNNVASCDHLDPKYVTKGAFTKLLNILVDNACIDHYEMNNILNDTATTKNCENIKSVYSEDELEELIANL